MELETLKELLGDERFSELETYVNDLVGQRDQARNESISGRRGMKEKLAALEAQQAALLEKLGVDSFDAVAELPDAKGAAEAAAQYEAKLKRAERQLAEAQQAREESEKKYRDSRAQAMVGEALAQHEFIARDLVASHVAGSLVWEGDELLYKNGDGNLVTVADGITGLAKSRPELLKASGAGGAGVKGQGARGAGHQQTMTRAEFEALPPAKQMAAAQSGVILQ